MIKKALSVIPALLMVGATAFASGYNESVVTLPDGSQVCSYPCKDSKAEITLPDGSKVCALHIPQGVESEVFVIKLDSAGHDMVQAMRPDDAREGQFSIRANSSITMEQAEKFGDVVSRYKVVSVRNPNSPQAFGSLFEATDLIPLTIKSGDDDILMGNLKVGLILKIDVLEAICDSVHMKANVVISNVESFDPATYEFSMPRTSLLAASQAQRVRFGGGFMIGGLQNVGEIYNEDEFMIFVNVKEANPDGKKK